MTNQKSTKSMMLINSKWGKEKSFNMIPTTNDCPYVECLFNVEEQVLAVIGKTKKEQFHQVPRLDENGDPQRKKGAKSNENPFKIQRITQETYSEYYLTTKEDIINFIKIFAINEKDFKYGDLFKTRKIKDETKKLVIT